MADPQGWTDEEIRILYERFSALVRRRCRAILRDSAAADDCCQMVFIKLLRHRETFAEADSKLAWLYRVSDTTCFDWLRSSKSRPTVPLTLVAEPAASDPEFARLEERQRALALLSILDGELQKIAVMHYIDELDQSQIAHALGLSRQTINAKLARVRASATGTEK